MNTWQQNLDLLTRHCRNAIAKAKRQGIVSMSRNNLRQIISTRDVDVPSPNAFERLLDEAIAKLPSGFIYTS